MRAYVSVSVAVCLCVYVLISSAKAVSSAPQFVGVLGVAYLADISFVQWTANFRCRRCSVRPKNIHNNNNSNHNTSEKSNYNNFATIFYVFSCLQFLYFSLGVVQFTFICSISVLYSQTQIQLRIWNWNIGKTIMNFYTCRKIHIYPIEHTLFILQENAGVTIRNMLRIIFTAHVAPILEGLSPPWVSLTNIIRFISS